MADTSFSIELKGLNIPDDIKSRMEAELRSTVLAEIAKTDLGKQVSVEPLAAAGERSLLSLPPLLGFIIRNLGRTGPFAERSVPSAAPTSATIGPLPAGSSIASPLPFGDASVADVIEGLYYRPDIQAAIAANSRAFAQLLSQDEQAARVFNELAAGTTNGASAGQRAIPLLAYVLAVVAGAAVGYWSRK